MSAADKEAASATFAPSLTTKQRPLDCPVSSESGSSNSGYYQNVTQKGKLILPTAIWILIVVGGLCFLSLLASLNKTMGTLDTLVEIEQNKAKLDKEHQHHSRPHKEALSAQPDNTKDHPYYPSTGRSWLSFPSWTSLEPTKHRMDSPDNTIADDSIKSLIDEVLQSAGMNEGEGPVTGKIALIGIGDSDGDKPDEKVLESVVNEILGAPGMLTGGPIEPVKVRSADEPKDQPGSTVITANIDKINININSPPVDDDGEEHRVYSDEHKSKKKNGHKKRPQPNELQRDRDEEMKSLDKSIDSLMANLVDPSASGSHDSFVPHPPGGLFMPMAHPPPYLMQFDPEEHSFRRHNNRLHSRIQPQGPLSPLSQLLMPFEPAPQPHSPMDSSIPAMFGRPQMSRFVITLGGDSVETTEKPAEASGEGSKKAVESQLNSMNSPLEFDLTPPIQMPPRLKLSSLKDIPLFGSHASEQSAGDHKDGVESLVFINGEPLISDKQLSPPVNEDTNKSGKLRNQVNDLFQLFFGPPPDSKLVVAPQISAPKFDNNKNSSKDANKESSPTEQPEAALVDNALDTGISFSKPILKNEDRKGVENLVDDLLGNMFALPQMGSEQEPVKIDSESSVVKAYQNSTAKESMLCECHRAGANSTSARPPAGQSGPGPANRPAGAGGPPQNATGPNRPPASGGSSSPGGGSPSGGGSSSGGSSQSASRPPGGSPQGAGGQSGGGSGSQSSGGGGGGGGSGQPLSPIGYVPANTPPNAYGVGGGPSGYPPMATAGQQSGNSPPQSVPQRPPGGGGGGGGGNFARPGTLLSALNNSTGGFIPRLLNRLNGTNIPCDGNNSTRLFPPPASLLPFAQQISNLLQSPGQSTPSNPSANSPRPPASSSSPSPQRQQS